MSLQLTKPLESGSIDVRRYDQTFLLSVWYRCLVRCQGLDFILGKPDCSYRGYRKSSRRKYGEGNPTCNHVSQHSGEMHSSHVYHGMVSQQEGRLNTCLKRSY